MSPRTVLTVVAVACVLPVAGGCKRTADPTHRGGASGPHKQAPRRAQRTIFDRDHAFTCSPDRTTRCGGVFPVRGAAADKERSEVAVLWSGEDAFRARIETLRRARRSIRIQALIFTGDEAGLLVADLLKQKKRAGLDVRVIVDAASNMAWQTQWMYFDLKKHGIEVEGYEALYLQWVTAELKLLDPLRPNKRFHDKLWVVDAEDPQHAVAIVGGLNIANEYFRLDPRPVNRWRDQDIVVRGALVRDVTAAFDRNYTFFKGLKRRLPPLQNTDNSWRLARAHMDKILKVKVPSWKDPVIERSIAATLRRGPELRFEPVDRARFLQSRPRLKETYIEQAYLDLIRRAKKRVLIANAYFVPWRALADELRRAARRGVRVVVLTNSPATNDIESVAVVSRYTYLDLLEVNTAPAVKRAGGEIAIYEWAGLPHKEGTLHAKYALFDEEEAVIGSFNLDPRSARLNSETALALRQGAIVRAMAKVFLEDKLPKAQRVTLAQAREFKKPGDVATRFKLLFTLPIRDWL